MQWHKGPFTISDAKEDVDLQAVCALLRETYWAANRPADVVRKSIAGSLCFALLFENRQIGFARVVSDFATHGILLDVIVHSEFRQQGLGKWLVQCVTQHPAVQSVCLTLWTVDADRLYRQFGFTEVADRKFMRRPSQTPTP